MPASNEFLAEVYCANTKQLIIVWPLVWRHEPQGDWLLVARLPEPQHAWR